MKKFGLLLVFFCQIGWAQDEILASIEGEPIKAGEVLYAFKKNRPDSIPTNYDTLDQYLERYINFKLNMCIIK